MNTLLPNEMEFTHIVKKLKCNSIRMSVQQKYLSNEAKFKLFVSPLTERCVLI